MYVLGITLTPNEKFFTIQKGEISRIDIENWRLMVDGCVKKPLNPII